MKLSQLLEGIPVTKMFQTMFGRMVTTHDVEVRGLQYDSRRVGRGDCFVALRGGGADGHAFVQQAINSGAVAVVVEYDDAVPDSLCMHAGVIKIVVTNSRKSLALMSANYYGHPSKNMRVIGVTGTNGKTTSTHLIRAILEAAGETVGLIGTIEYRFGQETIPATHTTPESLELNELLSRMHKAGCTSVSMEVSSHALHQFRVHGIEFRAAAFTNLTQDHLDYHKSMDEYFQAKKILFDMLSDKAWAVTNRDDDWGRRLFVSSRSNALSYGFDAGADVRVVNADLSIHGSAITLEYRGASTSFSSPLIGRFNVYNTLTAYSVGLALGVPREAMKQGIAGLQVVRGRFERIPSPAGWTAIIDYAHTPDALEKCLRTIHDVLPKDRRGKIITVFGAGGDRDKTKRPRMGAVASELSDLTIVTSDNPRTEDPEVIINDIFAGVLPSRQVDREVDRRKAIERALGLAGNGDVVLIAGKGHEDYQVIGTKRNPFSDREVVEEFLRSHQ
jgi:UDP-N-acetylmuramoyl-L-alanyl-D-glutamate--2,6-diaminopimelate ligase